MLGEEPGLRDGRINPDRREGKRNKVQESEAEENQPHQGAGGREGRGAKQGADKNHYHQQTGRHRKAKGYMWHHEKPGNSWERKKLKGPSKKVREPHLYIRKYWPKQTTALRAEWQNTYTGH